MNNLLDFKEFLEYNKESIRDRAKTLIQYSAYHDAVETVIDAIIHELNKRIQDEADSISNN